MGTKNVTPAVPLLWIDAQPIGSTPLPYVWAIACRDCETLMGRYHYLEPSYVDGEWRPAATYDRTLIVPQLDPLDSDDSQSGLPVYGSSRPREGAWTPPRLSLSPALWREVHGPVIAYCPRQDCHLKHLLKPPNQYGPTPDDELWPPWVNPLTGEDLSLSASLHPVHLRARRITEPRVVKTRKKLPDDLRYDW
jgi:hypothetical protein